MHGGHPGRILRDKVKIPENYNSSHTLIGFRWDSMDTAQLWLHCADIAIFPNSTEPVKV